MDNRTSRRAAALIVVLWVVAIIGTITMVFTRQANLALKVSRNINDGNQAKMLAEAGIYRVMAELVKDGQTGGPDSDKDAWSSNPEAFSDVPLGNGVYRVIRPDSTTEGAVAYGAVDESGKLNINTATRDQLLRLPNATPEYIDPILDWRDEDDTPGEFGAEIDYYQSLPEPCLPKNGLFDSVEELLLVKGITLDLLYGEDTNTNGILDLNENDGDKIYPLDNNDGKLDRGWYPFLTAYSYDKNLSSEGEDRVNINTADKEKLTQEFGDVLTEQEIDAIISVRGQQEFASVGELLNKSAAGSSGGGNTGGGEATSNGGNQNRNTRGGNRNSGGGNRGNRGLTDEGRFTWDETGSAQTRDRSAGGNQSGRGRPASSFSRSGGSNSSGGGRGNASRGGGSGQSNQTSQPAPGSSNSISISRDKLKQIIDRISVTDEEKLTGRININTAPREVLRCLIGDNENLIDDILEYRESSKGPFNDIGGLLDVSGVTDEIFQQIANSICAKSCVFSARSTGYILNSRAYKEIYAILDRGISPPGIRVWKVTR
ncbi:MAG: helix-hairpin-helix domain-containing protein [bacterium]